jgi:hypothetical protein
MTDYARVVIEADSKGRLSISAETDEGTGGGYRLAGPKYVNDLAPGARRATTVVRHELTADDVARIRDYLRIWDAVNGQKSGIDVVTICGSMRFYDDMLAVAAKETANGAIVLMPHAIVAPADQDGDVKIALDALHRRKIDMSNRVIVVTRAGYVGTSTAGEITYAEMAGKPVTYVDSSAGGYVS